MAAPAPELRPLEPAVVTPPDVGAGDDPELKWLREVYQGDTVPQLTTRAVVMGLLLGIVMAFSNLYVGLKTGWGLGVAITACIMSWAIFKLLKPVLGSEPSILENNCMQSTASAAGYSTGSTLVSAFSAYVMITGHHLPMMLTMGLVFCLAMLGVFMAIPMKRNMVNVEQLPFPSGTAAAETLRSLFSSGAEAMRKAKALFWSMGIGMVVAIGRDGLEWIPNYLPLEKLFTKLGWNRAATVVDSRGYTFSFELSTIMVGAGAIMGIRVGASMLLGSIIAYGVLAPIMHGMPDGHGATVIKVLGYRAIVSWTVWGGVALMTTAALLNFFMQWKTLARAFSGIAGMFKKKDANAVEDPLARIEVPASWFVGGSAIAAIGCIALNKWAFGIPLRYGVLAVLLSGVLAIVACRATGETDTTPIGALGKITQLTYGYLIPSNITANLMTANVTSSIASSSADLLTDLKSGYLLGANPRKQFLAQFYGVFAGTLVAVPAFYLLTNDAKILGSDKFPAPAAQVWKAVAELMAQGIHSLHPSALWAMGVGGGLGIVITLLEKFFPNHKHLIPSPTGIGLAFVIPAWNSISMFLGALIAWVLERRKKKFADDYVVPVASGLIAGESIAGVGIAVFQVVASLLSGK